MPILVHLFVLILHVGIVYTFQHQIEGDESIILYWGLRFWQTLKWQFLSNADAPVWETPASWIFGGFEYFFGVSSRWLALGFSWISLKLWYDYLRTFKSAKEAQLSVYLLATSPFFLYFSLSLGPLNVFWILTLYFWARARQSFLHYFVMLGGLFYYAYFRVIWLFEILTSKGRNTWKSYVIAIGILGIYILTLGLAGEWSLLVSKGSYGFERGWYYILSQYAQSLLVWFTPAWRDLSWFREHSYLELGRGIVDLSYPDTVLGLVQSVLTLLGMFRFFLAPSKERIDPEKEMILLVLLSIFLGGWSSSLVHLTTLSLFFSVFMVGGYTWLGSKFKFLRSLLLYFPLLSFIHFAYSVTYRPSGVFNLSGGMIFKEWKSELSKLKASGEHREAKLLILSFDDFVFHRFYQEKWNLCCSSLGSIELRFVDLEGGEFIELNSIKRQGFTAMAIPRPQPLTEGPKVLLDHSIKVQKAYQQLMFHLNYVYPGLQWKTLSDQMGRPQVDWLDLQ